MNKNGSSATIQLLQVVSTRGHDLSGTMEGHYADYSSHLEALGEGCSMSGQQLEPPYVILMVLKASHAKLHFHFALLLASREDI